MSQLRKFTKAGALISQMTLAGVIAGPLDFVGGGVFYTIDIDDVWVFQLAGKSPVLVASPIASGFGVNRQARGIAVLPTDGPGGPIDSLERDGANVALMLNDTVAGFFSQLLRLYDPRDWSILSSDLVGTIPATVGPICAMGNRLYYSIVNAGTPPIVLGMLDPGPPPVLIRQWSIAALPIDMAHDGVFLWFLTPTDIEQYEQEGRAAPNLLRSFAHGVTNPSGLTTDGQDLYVHSRL